MRRTKCDRCGRHDISEDWEVDVDNTPFSQIGVWMGSNMPSSSQDICLSCVREFEEFMKGIIDE